MAIYPFFCHCENLGNRLAAIYFLDSWIASFIFLTCNDKSTHPLNLRKGGGIFGKITTRKGGGIFGLPRKNCIFSRNDKVVDCHDLLKGKFRNDDLEAIRRLARFAIRKDLQNAFFCK